jgi:hypothetical protein
MVGSKYLEQCTLNNQLQRTEYLLTCTGLVYSTPLHLCFTVHILEYCMQALALPTFIVIKFSLVYGVNSFLNTLCVTAHASLLPSTLDK